MIKNAERFLLFGIMFLFVKKNDKKRIFVKPKSYLSAVFSALFSSIAYTLQLLSASHLPAAVQFPVTTGGTIIFTTLFGVIIFKEKINNRQAAGILLCFIATVIFVI